MPKYQFLAVFAIVTLLCVTNVHGGWFTWTCPKCKTELSRSVTECPVCVAKKKADDTWGTVQVVALVAIVIFILAVGHSFNTGYRSGGMAQAQKDKLQFEQQGFACTIRENNGRIDLIVYQEDNVSVKDTIYYTT